MKKKLILIPLVLVLIVAMAFTVAGCAGESGLKGGQGPIGPQGEQGEQGAQGEQGEIGLQGVMGRTGQKGATGSTGATGEQGIQGDTGERGLGGVGARGATGATGATGPQGLQGDAGEDADYEDLQALIEALEERIATFHRPQIDGISPLVLSTSTPEVLTGIVEIVFDFYDAEDDLRDLMIDWSLEPYTQERKAQTNFLATEDMGIDPGVLAAMAEVGLVPSYNAEEQSWTLRIDTTATMTAAIFETGIFGWVAAVGDPVFPAGRYDWYIEVRDFAGNKWGNMMSPPAYSHYVNYFHSD